jgi:hypothetical protein
MRNKLNKSILNAKKCLPIFMLAVLFSGIAIASFHIHECTENSDLCAACSLQHSFSSPTIEPTGHVIVLPKSLPEPVVLLNEKITDPSQKTVCSSHAPPQFI